MTDNDHETLKQCVASCTEGALLSYYTLGTGPGLIILHGSVSYGLSHQELGKLLADSFTVHLVSRRERGLSSPFPDSVTSTKAVLPLSTVGQLDDSEDPAIVIGGRKCKRTYSKRFTSAVLETELSDLNQIIEITKARYMLGISTGAVLMLAACTNPLLIPTLVSIKKMILFEPPLQFQDFDTGLDVEAARHFEDEMASGDLAGSMVTAMKIVQLGPSWLPKGIMKFITSLMLQSEKRTLAAHKTEVQENTTMFKLAPVLRYDFALVERMVCLLSTFQRVAEGRQVLLLGGSKSPAYFRLVMDQLARTMVGARRIVIQGVGHEVVCNKNFRGRPDKAVLGIMSLIEDGRLS